MIRTLIRKEILDHILSIRFAVSLSLALLFLIPSTYMLANDYGRLHRELGPRQPFSSTGGMWYSLNREIPTLRVLATGLDEGLSLSASSHSYAGPSFGENEFVHNYVSDLFSHLDFVFFINIVGSLMAFAFTYDAISGEKQLGTLRLVMTTPISRAVFLLSKFLGSYISFVITLIPRILSTPILRFHIFWMWFIIMSVLTRH